MKKYYLYTVPILLIVAGYFFLSNTNSSVDNYTMTTDGITYSLDYIPNKKLIERDLKGSEESYDEISNKYKDHCYFKLNITSTGGQDILKMLSEKFGELESNEIVRILSFHSKKNFKLNINDIEIPCSLYHLDRTFVEQKGLEIIAVFNIESVGNEISKYGNNVAFKFNAEIFNAEMIEFNMPDNILRTLTKV